MSKITEYFKSIKGELKHVNWPTKKQAITYTIFVIVLSVLVAYFLGVFDFIFSKGLEKLILF
jgi:preprotein translocase subunit SecE